MTVEYQTPGTKLPWSTLGEWISWPGREARHKRSDPVSNHLRHHSTTPDATAA